MSDSLKGFVSFNGQRVPAVVTMENDYVVLHLPADTVCKNVYHALYVKTDFEEQG